MKMIHLQNIYNHYSNSTVCSKNVMKHKMWQLWNNLSLRHIYVTLGLPVNCIMDPYSEMIISYWVKCTYIALMLCYVNGLWFLCGCQVDAWKFPALCTMLLVIKPVSRQHRKPCRCWRLVEECLYYHFVGKSWCSHKMGRFPTEMVAAGLSCAAWALWLVRQRPAVSAKERRTSEKHLDEWEICELPC